MKEKGIDSSTTKKHKWALVGVVFAYLNIIVLFVTIDNKAWESFLKLIKISPKMSYLFFMFFALLWVIFTICITYYNEVEKFNKDTINLFSFYIFVGALLFAILLLSNNYKVISTSAQAISNVFLISGLILWAIYYFRCLKTIRELNKDTSDFFAKSLVLVLNALLVWWASKEVFRAIDVKTDYIYQFFNILINFSYPLIGMFTYVRPEIDEFDKLEKTKKEFEKTKKEFEKTKNELEKTKNELEKTRNKVEKTRNKVEKTRNKVEKTRNKVERFINRFKIIDYQIRTEKNNISMLKRFVNRFATLEDLDNLEKIIAEKRKDLD